MHFHNNIASSVRRKISTEYCKAILNSHSFFHQAKKDASYGKISSAKTKGYVALGLNIIAIFSYFVVLIAFISVGATSVSASSSYDYYSYYIDYSYYTDYYYYYYYYSYYYYY